MQRRFWALHCNCRDGLSRAGGWRTPDRSAGAGAASQPLELCVISADAFLRTRELCFIGTSGAELPGGSL